MSPRHAAQATVLLKMIEALMADTEGDQWMYRQLANIRKQLVDMELIPDANSPDGIFRE